MNQCMIPLSWSIETSSDLLQVMEGPRMLEPVSENLILIDRRPSTPGLYNEKMFLEVCFRLKLIGGCLKNNIKISLGYTFGAIFDRCQMVSHDATNIS